MPSGLDRTRRDETVSGSGGVPAPRIVGLVDTSASRAEPVVASSNGETSPVTSYVPRLLLRHLADDPERRAWTVDGTVVFVDISGFTKLSERLAKHGKEGAEQVTEAIETCFTDLLAVAYANGGGLIKFGGDALLLLFQGEGHEAMACRSAVWMRRSLREVGRIDLPGARVQLRMSVGAHTGTFHLFLVGTSHRELIAAGSRVDTHRRDGACGRRGRDPHQSRAREQASGSMSRRDEGAGRVVAP